MHNILAHEAKASVVRLGDVAQTVDPKHAEEVQRATKYIDGLKAEVDALETILREKDGIIHNGFGNPR